MDNYDPMILVIYISFFYSLVQCSQCFLNLLRESFANCRTGMIMMINDDDDNDVDDDDSLQGHPERMLKVIRSQKMFEPF